MNLVFASGCAGLIFAIIQVSDLKKFRDMSKNRLIRFFGLLVLLVPIGFGAVWGAFHSRPDYYWLKRITKDGESYLLGKHYLKHNAMLTCLNTANGEYKSVRLPRQSEILRGYNGFDGHEFWNLESDRETQNPLCVVSVPELSIIAKSMIVGARDPMQVCVVGSHIVRIQSDSVTVESTENRIVTDSMPLGFSVGGLLYQIVGTENVLVYESSTTSGRVCNFVLLEIDSGKINQIAGWKALDHRVMDRNSPQTIVSLLADGAAIETIDAIDGKVYSSKSLPDDFGLRLPIFSMEGDFDLNWIHFFKVSDDLKGILHDVERHRLLCKRHFSQNDRELLVLDLQTGLILFHFQLPEKSYRVEDMQIIGDQLFLASRDGRVFFYDLSSGTLLRTIDPFRFVHWINCICGIAFLGWCVLWCKFSKGTKFHALVDVVVVTLPLLAYVIMVYTHDLAQGRSDLTIVSVGIMLGLSVLASIWYVIARPRWSMGVLPAILCVLLSLALHSFTVGKAGIFAPMVIWAIVCTNMAASCFVLLLRSRSIQFCFGSRSIQFFCIDPVLHGAGQMTTEQKRKVFPLRDLFLWTACFGIFFAMLKNDLCIVWMDWSILVIAIPLGFFIAIIGTIALFLAMYCTDLIANRVARLSCAFVVPCALFADPAGRTVLPMSTVAVFEDFWFPYYLLPVWLTVYLGLYAFRLRGWRIRLISEAAEIAFARDETA